MEEAVKRMFELAEELKNLRNQKKEVEQREKEVNAELDNVECELADLMAGTETQNFTKSGTTYSLTIKNRASAVAERKDKLFDALKKNGYGDLVYETVNANSLSAFVNEQVAQNEDNLPAWLDGLVNIYEQAKVSVRKAARK